MDFYERYTELTDVELLDILKRRKDYQDLAVETAVKIAIERKLISTEQDLLSPEFEPVKSSGIKIFPEISNAYHRQRLIGSIFRFIYIISFLPLVYAFMKYAEGQMFLTFLGVGTSMLWFILSFSLSRSNRKLIFIPLFAILISASLYTGWQIFGKTPFHFLDLFILLAGTILPAYLLLYLRRLI